MSKKNRQSKNIKTKPGQKFVPKQVWNKKTGSLISMLVIVVALGAYLLFFKSPSEPKFVKQGEVTFFKSGTKAVIKKIDVEVANNPATRTQGLMYRSKMDELNGMLFIFESPDIHKFWMKNTIIPLDIAFVDTLGVIDTIYRKTEPFSERSLPSRRKVQFVVETNGGFSDKYNIKEGDLISFDVDKK